MATIRRILCPIDFSDTSRHAFDVACGVAHAHAASIVALHVALLSQPPHAMEPFAVDRPRRNNFTVLRRRLEAFVEEAIVPVETIVREGLVVNGILEHALDVDLIVVGTHGRGGLSRVLLGSVTERLLAVACRPVLVVPGAHHGEVPFGSPPFRHVLCAIDFSAASLRAAAYAAALAPPAVAHVTLLTVLEPRSRFAPVPLTGPGSGEFEAAEALPAARARLHETARAVFGAGSVVTQLVLRGDAADQILATTADAQAGLIVMGVRSGAAAPFGLGSTTNHVVRSAQCPVLVVGV